MSFRRQYAFGHKTRESMLLKPVKGSLFPTIAAFFGGEGAWSTWADILIGSSRPRTFALLKNLLRVFGAAFGEIDTYQRSVPSDGYLTRLLKKEHFITVVAMKGKEVVGGLAAYLLDKFEQDRREIYIYDLAVLQEHRRKGIATGMIGVLRKIAAARNAYVIFVQADLEDAPAIALYESLGTKETALHFDIEVRASRAKRSRRRRSR